MKQSKAIKEKDKPLNKAIEDIEARYQAKFDGAIRKSVAKITKQLLQFNT